MQEHVQIWRVDIAVKELNIPYESAMFTATDVFPVPPFPLAIETIIGVTG
jgi:hypothetical protein